MASDVIRIQGARAHNLKNVTLEIPRNQLVVFTGVSGSGKSSLVFDTLYAEGHHRYVESLSAYARQFLARMQKPDVDFIHGLSPAIAIEQRVISSNPRSTVGSVTEILDYLRLLFARVGRTFSPVSGREVTSDTVTSVVNHIQTQPAGSRVYLLCDVPYGDRDPIKELELTLQKGFSRVWDGPAAHTEGATGGRAVDIEALLAGQDVLQHRTPGILTLLIDRFAVSSEQDEDFQHRIADSVSTAFNEGNGSCRVVVELKDRGDRGDREDISDNQGLLSHLSPLSLLSSFSERFEMDGIVFERPTMQLFNFNNSYGACPTCEGFGRIIGYDPDLIVPDKNKSVFDGAIAPWKGATLGNWQKEFIAQADAFDFPVHRPYWQLTPQQIKLLWDGNRQVAGINDFFKDVESQFHKIQYRVIAARYRGYTTCPECGGSRLRKEALYVKVADKTIADFLALSVADMSAQFDAMQLPAHEQQIATRLLTEIRSRLHYLLEVGLGYLNLSRKVSTLSGGETQRINLATSLGSNLTGSLYILDEPSIGLHPRDSDRLIGVLENLRNLGNTVIVVEHDEAVMQRADFLVDVGPQAGEHGGHIVATGVYDDIVHNPASLTGKYLSGEVEIKVPAQRRKPIGYITLSGAREHNLKDVTARFPLGVLAVITGVSGSGKSTLVKQVFHPALQRALGHQTSEKPGEHNEIAGDIKLVNHVELVDQNAIGKNVRSNPVTYVGAYDLIRDLFASQPAAKDRQLKPASFSFNVAGGRCETCQGEGQVTVAMQFLPDIKLTCETCGGKRFKDVVLEVQHHGKNIFDVLNLSVDEALGFFLDKPKIAARLQKLLDVGLGYVRLGQSTSTLSGGEAQRLKLASFLDKGNADTHTLYIFDEPTTGLHFADVDRLLQVFYRLVDQGNTVMVIEHNLEVIKCADWLLDIGPEGGDDGGNLLYEGPTDGLLAVDASYTAHYLRGKLVR